MSRHFFRGNAHFEVPDGDIALINKLRRFRLKKIEINEPTENAPKTLFFDVPLVSKNEVERLLAKKAHNVTINSNFFSFLNFFYQRVTLVVTAILCCATFVFLNQFTFHVQVKGLKGEEYTQVAQFLKQKGITRFGLNTSSEIENVAQELTEKFEFIAHANAYTNGLTLTFAVHRAENPAAKIPVGDITATHEGVIAEIVVFSGTAMVSTGDVVRVGDILVAGPRATAIIQIANGTEVICVINNVVVE